MEKIQKRLSEDFGDGMKHFKRFHIKLKGLDGKRKPLNTIVQIDQNE